MNVDKSTKPVVFDWCRLKFQEASELLKEINSQLDYWEVDWSDLESPLPEVSPDAWMRLRDQIQALNGQVQSFARRQGNRVVIDRPPQQLRPRRG